MRLDTPETVSSLPYLSVTANMQCTKVNLVYVAPYVSRSDGVFIVEYSCSI